MSANLNDTKHTREKSTAATATTSSAASNTAVSTKTSPPSTVKTLVGNPDIKLSDNLGFLNCELCTSEPRRGGFSTLPCGHSMCMGCIEAIPKNLKKYQIDDNNKKYGEGRLPCPQCNQPYHTLSQKPNLALKNLIRSIKEGANTGTMLKDISDLERRLEDAKDATAAQKKAQTQEVALEEQKTKNELNEKIDQQRILNDIKIQRGDALKTRLRECEAKIERLKIEAKKLKDELEGKNKKHKPATATEAKTKKEKNLEALKSENRKLKESLLEKNRIKQNQSPSKNYSNEKPLLLSEAERGKLVDEIIHTLLYVEQFKDIQWENGLELIFTSKGKAWGSTLKDKKYFERLSNACQKRRSYKLRIKFLSRDPEGFVWLIRKKGSDKNVERDRTKLTIMECSIDGLGHFEWTSIQHPSVEDLSTNTVAKPASAASAAASAQPIAKPTNNPNFAAKMTFVKNFMVAFEKFVESEQIEDHEWEAGVSVYFPKTLAKSIVLDMGIVRILESGKGIIKDKNLSLRLTSLNDMIVMTKQKGLIVEPPKHAGIDITSYDPIQMKFNTRPLRKEGNLYFKSRPFEQGKLKDKMDIPAKPMLLSSGATATVKGTVASIATTSTSVAASARLESNPSTMGSSAGNQNSTAFTYNRVAVNERIKEASDKLMDYCKMFGTYEDRYDQENEILIHILSLADKVSNYHTLIDDITLAVKYNNPSKLQLFQTLTPERLDEQSETESVEEAIMNFFDKTNYKDRVKAQVDILKSSINEALKECKRVFTRFSAAANPTSSSAASTATTSTLAVATAEQASATAKPKLVYEDLPLMIGPKSFAYIIAKQLTVEVTKNEWEHGIKLIFIPYHVYQSSGDLDVGLRVKENLIKYLAENLNYENVMSIGSPEELQVEIPEKSKPNELIMYKKKNGLKNSMNYTVVKVSNWTNDDPEIFFEERPFQHTTAVSPAIAPVLMSSSATATMGIAVANTCSSVTTATAAVASTSTPSNTKS